jgi:AcrR family transcriptional regulator
MGPPVKRSYDSPLRRDKAQATRSAVIAAAATMFATRGYVATTADAVAEKAGVSRATVFNSVGGKPDLLRAAYRSAVRGDDPDTPLGEQARSRKNQAEPDPARLLGGYARVCTEIAPRLSPLYGAIRAAADADSEAAELWSELQSERLYGAGRVIEALQQRGHLRAGLDTKSAADILWVLNDPGLHHLLVERRGWSRARFRIWLAETMKSQLLASTTP